MNRSPWRNLRVLGCALALAGLGTQAPSLAMAQSPQPSTTARTDGKYIPSDVPSTDLTAPKPLPTSDPNGAIEQYNKEVGPVFVANEQKLDAINTWINNQPSFETSGYLGVIEDAKTFSIKLLWHGTDAILATAAEMAQKSGANVEVIQRPYSQSDLEVATATLWKSKDILSAAGFDLTEIVQVSRDSDSPVIHGSLKSSASAESIIALVEKITGIKYTLGDDRRIVPTSGRADDTSPFFGGDLMVSSKPPTGNSDICSTGFTVNWNGGDHTTTARHCQPTSNAAGAGWYSYTTNARMGTIQYTANTGALNVLAGSGARVIYTGSYSSTTSNTVANVVTPGIGSAVCNEGGNSGAHCNLIISATGVSTPDSSSSSGYVSTVRADSNGGGIANMAGDSGAPIAKGYGSSGTEASAVGMTQAGDTDSRLSSSYCTSLAARSPQTCYSSVEFTYMSTIQNHNPITVVTN